MAFAKDPSRAFALTQAYIAADRLMEAMVVCKKGIKNQPDTVEGRLLLARVFAAQGKVPKAIDELKSVLEQKPDSADAHFAMGQMLEKSGKFEDAIEQFKETLRKNRGHGEATAALKAKGVDWSPGPSPEEIAAAEAAKKAAEEAEAKKKLEEESRLAEEAWQAEEQKRQAASRSRNNGTPSQSARASSGPIAQFPNDPAYQSNAGAYGMFSGPVPVAHAGRRLGPGFTFGLAAMLLLIVAGAVAGLAYHKKTQDTLRLKWTDAEHSLRPDTTRGLKDGIKSLEEALAVSDNEPKIVGAYAYALAELAFERGEKDLDQKATDAAKRAMKVSDTEPDSVAAQMIVLRSTGKLDEAVALAKKLGPDETLHIHVRMALGRTYAALGKVQDMIKVADSLKDVPDAGALTFVGEAYRRIGDRARARIELDSAIKNNLDHDPARALRALVILEDDDVTNLNIAIDDLKSVKDLGKDAVGAKQRGYASLGLAIVGKKIGRPQREIDADLQNARSVLGGDPEVPLFDAKSILDDDPGKAVQLAQQAIKADRVRLAPYLIIVDAATHSKTPQWAVADAALQDATAVFGDNLEIGLAKAGRLRDEGRFDDAIAALKAMIPAHDQSEVYRDIGKVSLKKEMYPDAVEWLKKAADKAKSRSPGIQANVYTWLGRAYAKAGDHAAAKEIYAQSLAATSEYTSTYYWLAQSLKELKEVPAAKDACKRYLIADPNGPYREGCEKLRAE
jgi:tetratricopeptide (TPR) repeat protein